MLLAGAVLSGFALAGSALVAYVHQQTRARIAANESAATRRLLDDILPPGRHDNDMVRDTLQVTAPEMLGSEAPLTVYRARRNGKPVAAVLTVVAPDGYNGAIRLLVGIARGGELLGVRVLSEHETPGLGDRIEAGKSDWIRQFRGRSLGDPPQAQWRVRKDGGAFDQLTGATITPRAIVKAVRGSLIYFRRHRTELFRKQDTD